MNAANLHNSGCASDTVQTATTTEEGLALAEPASEDFPAYDESDFEDDDEEEDDD